MGKPFYLRHQCSCVTGSNEAKEIQPLFCIGWCIEPGHKTIVAVEFLTDPQSESFDHVAVFIAIPGKLQVKRFIKRIEVLVWRRKDGKSAGLPLSNDAAVFNSEVHCRIAGD